MRVALLTNFVPPYRVSLFRALRKEVGELRILVSTAMEKNRGWKAEWEDLDVVVQRNLSIRRTWRTNDFAEPYEMHVPYDTVSQLRSWRPDRIITGELGARSMQALTYAKSANVPAVLWATLSDITEQNRGAARDLVRKLMIPRFDAVIVNGEAGARYIRKFRSDEPTRVPYTTDMRPFYDIPLEREGRGALFVGALTERKWVRLLLDAAVLWAARHPNDRLTIALIGQGPLEADLKGRQLPANLTLEWTGHVAYEKLPDWFRDARIVIFPTLADEWGMVVNEALASGVPVLGSVNSQAVDELIEHGVNGWRFEPGAPETLADMMDRALNIDDATLLRMRAAARKSAARVEPEQAARKMAELLRAL